MEISQERMERFWKWCGLNLHTTVNFGKVWLNDKGVMVWNHRYLSIDLNNLFKYAVPKLPFLRMDYEPITEMYNFETIIPNSINLAAGSGKDPAIALFLAIERLIGG